MDFNDTPEEAKFRAEVSAWLAKNAPAYAVPANSRGIQGAESGALVDLAKRWQNAKAKGGYGHITWPKEFGGMGGTPIQSVIFSQEERKHHVPEGVFTITYGMCMPTIMTHGTPAQKERFVKKALFGEEVWCQLFSEPSAGSDVANVRTRAEKKGDEWIVNGQKVWTSGAHYSDHGILLARTDPDVPKHKGLTMFILDMRAKGVEIRPIKQVTGGSNFNEVFFSDVRIPDSMRVDDVGNGWRVGLTTLMNERAAISASADPGQQMPALLNLARRIEFEDGPAIKNAMVRDRIAEWFVQSQGLKYTVYRSLTALSRGETPGPENSVSKTISGRRMLDLAAFAMELQEMAGMSAGEDAVYTHTYLMAPGGRVAGGTDEIMRNIIAERVLGLPGDIRVDKDIPFKDIPKGR